MLRWRLVLGVLFIALFVGLCWLDYVGPAAGLFLFPLALLLALAAGGELLDLLARHEVYPSRTVVYLGLAAIVGSNAQSLWRMAEGEEPGSLAMAAPLVAFVATLMAALLAEMGRYREPGASTTQAAAAVFIVAYVGLPISFLVQMRVLGGPAEGMAALAAVAIADKLCDIGAFVAGKLLGRHKMAPVLSPGKTWEGAVGGIALALLGSWWFFGSLRPAWLESPAPADVWRWIVFGGGVAVAGILGDLAESLLKRDAGKKDSSNWLPGIGGVLDMVDSLLFAAPVGYLLYAALFLGR